MGLRFLNRLIGPSFSRQARHPAPRYAAETLESRVLLSAITWTGATNSDWDTATNWSGSVIPTATDDVTITSGSTVTHAAGVADAVNSIVSNGSVSLSLGSIAVSGNLLLGGVFQLAGGKLIGATVTGSPQKLQMNSGTLDGVTLNADATLNDGGLVTVVDGLTVNSNLTLAASSSNTVLSFRDSPSQSLGGSGQITMGGSAPNMNVLSADNSAGDLTIATTFTIHGAGGNIGTTGGSGALTLHGTIAADSSGGTITIGGGAGFSNQGIIEAVAGGTVVAQPSLGSTGNIIVNNGDFTFGGVVSATANVQRTGGTIHVTGTLTGTQTFDSSTGFWNLSGTALNDNLTFGSGGGITFDGPLPVFDNVTLNSDIIVPNGIRLTIRDGLTLNNAQVLITSTGSATSLNFDNSPSQTLGGNGAIVFSGPMSVQDEIDIDLSFGSLTVLTGITIIGPNGSIVTSGTNGTCVFQGTLNSNGGGNIVVSGTNFADEGTLDAFGGVISIAGDFAAVSSPGGINIGLTSGAVSQVAVTGNFAFGGNLNILLLGGLVPPQGSVFDVLSYGTQTGNFAAVTGLSSANVTFTPVILSTLFRLNTTQGGPGSANVDLSLSNLSYGAGTYHPGDNLSFSFTENNTGPGAASGFSIAVVLSQDAIFGNSDDVLLQSIAGPALEGMASSIFSNQATLPTSMLPGKYHLMAFIDPQGSVPETDKSNNLIVSPAADVVVAPLPADLSLTSITYTPGTYNPGDTLVVSGTANNSGAGSVAPFDIQADLSQDTVFGNRDDIPLFTVHDNGLNFGGPSSGSGQGVIPADIPPGAYHVVVKIDSTDVIAETDETNNVFVSPLPDIIIPAPPVPPAPKPSTIGGTDPNFGTAGVAVHDVGITTTSDVAVQSDGKSVIVGAAGDVGSRDFALTRYTPTGGLDTSFGNQGTVRTDFSGRDDRATSVSILPDGRILVAGTSAQFSGGQQLSSDFALAQYNPDGSPDTTFGNSTGHLLISFANGGTSNDEARTLALRPDGTIFVGGSSDAAGRGKDFAIVALAPDGSPLTSFSGTGQGLFDFDRGDDIAQAIAFAKNGDLVLAGSSQAPAAGIVSIALVELRPNGSVEKAFNKTGRVTDSLRGVDDEAASVLVQPDGKIVVGGLSTTGSASDASLSTDFALVRFTSAGRADRTFGGGSVITSFGQPTAITKILLAGGGKIVASGKTASSIAAVVPNQLDLALAEYNPNGTLNTTFAGTGHTIISLASAGSAPLAKRASVLSSGDVSFSQKFDQLKQTAQGALATSQGGQLLDVGTNGADTIEAAIVASGVDLVAHVSSTLAAQVVGGSKGMASVQVSNTGPDAAAGVVTVNLLASPGVTTAGATALAAAPEKIRLATNQSQTFKVPFALAGSLVDGSYNIVVQVDPGSLKDLNVADGIAAAAPGFNVSHSFVDLAGSNFAAPASLVRGKKANVSFAVTNNGNAAFAGATSVQFLTSPDRTAASGAALATASLAVNLKPGASKTFKTSFLVSSTLPAGTVFLLAQLDPDNLLNEPNLANNLMATPGMIGVQ